MAGLWVGQRWGCGQRAVAPTWRVAGTDRLRPSTEMLTEMLMPAKRRLLFPRMEASALLGAWEGTVSHPSQMPGASGAPDGHSVPSASQDTHQLCKTTGHTHLLLPGAPDTGHGLMEPVDGFPAEGETALRTAEARANGWAKESRA